MAIQSHNQNEYCRNHHRNIRKRHRNVKITSHYHSLHLILYKRAEHLPSGLGKFLECRKCNILVITQALVLCLINTHSPSGAAHPRASCMYIRQSTLACVITYTCMYILCTYCWSWFCQPCEGTTEKMDPM